MKLPGRLSDIRFVFAAGILVCTVGALVVAFFVARWAHEREGVRIPDFVKVADDAALGTYEDSQGSPVSLGSYGPNVAVITWASWCPSCGDQLKLLDAYLAAHPTNYRILGINRKEPRETAEAYLAYVGRPQHITFITDTRDWFFAHSLGYTVPELVVYGPDGMVTAHIHGTFTEAELAAVLAPQ